jgi:hypothetical protein
VSRAPHHLLLLLAYQSMALDKALTVHNYRLRAAEDTVRSPGGLKIQSRGAPAVLATPEAEMGGSLEFTCSRPT